MDLKIAICDDDLYDLNSEYEIISKVLKEESIDNSIDLYTSSDKFLESNKHYNLVFLDIEMNGQNGIELAENIRKLDNKCFVFFVTNHEAYLDDAFNQHAFRFWLKPLQHHKLVYGIKSVIKELEESEQYIIVHNNTKDIKIYVRNIIYIYAYGNKVHIVTTKGEIETSNLYRDVYGKLKKYNFFCESQRAYCINFRYVKNYNKDRVYCGNKDKTYEVYISRRKYNNFNKSFLEWVGGK